MAQSAKKGFSITVDCQPCAWNHSQSEFMAEVQNSDQSPSCTGDEILRGIGNLAPPADMMGCFALQTLEVRMHLCSVRLISHLLHGKHLPLLLALQIVRKSIEQARSPLIAASQLILARTGPMIASLTSVPCSCLSSCAHPAMDTQYPPHDRLTESRQLARRKEFHSATRSALGLYRCTEYSACDQWPRPEFFARRQRVTPRFLLSMMEAGCQVWRNGGVKVSSRFWS
ncbi:hypothetical protein BDW75DRAFT_98074 [Aspergillus navahoensis]